MTHNTDHTSERSTLPTMARFRMALFTEDHGAALAIARQWRDTAVKNEKDVLSVFDECVAAALPRVSHIEYDSHEICKHFAEKVRERIAAMQESAR